MDEKQLIKKINRLQITVFLLISIMAIGFGYLVFTNKNTNDELTVKRLTLIDENGTNRVQLTSDLSKAPFGGKEISRKPLPGIAGIIFMGPNGDEVGGIGFGGDENTAFSVNAMDYSGIPLEAIGFRKIQTKDFTSAGLVIEDNPRKDYGFDVQKFIEEDAKGIDGKQVKILQSQMIDRVDLSVTNHKAGLTLKDSKGRDRIILSVDENDIARIQVIDTTGQIISELPKE